MLTGMLNDTPAGYLPVLARRIRCYQLCPFSKDSLPGAVLQHILSSARGDTVLDTYDFVDNISLCKKIGWQVKSTKSSTPVTWKRAKIPNKAALIANSKLGSSGCRKLGNAIIEFCNHHAEESIAKYNLDELRLARLVIFTDEKALYYERVLCTKSNPKIFDPDSYDWSWSAQKTTTAGAKEQLPALHGHDKAGLKSWAWHGLGENQLHFVGEQRWWPSTASPSAPHVRFDLPDPAGRLGWAEFTDALAISKS